MVSQRLPVANTCWSDYTTCPGSCLARAARNDNAVEYEQSSTGRILTAEPNCPGRAGSRRHELVIRKQRKEARRLAGENHSKRTRGLTTVASVKLRRRSREVEAVRVVRQRLDTGSQGWRVHRTKDWGRTE